MGEKTEAELRFVAAVESIAADFKRYVDVTEASLAHTKDVLDQQMAMQQKALDDLQD